jgi:arylsulfatase A-like enzyme
MRTIMVLNGPGVTPGRMLRDIRTIDFAPTLAELLGISAPRQAAGRVLTEALSR